MFLNKTGQKDYRNRIRSIVDLRNLRPGLVFVGLDSETEKKERLNQRGKEEVRTQK